MTLPSAPQPTVVASSAAVQGEAPARETILETGRLFLRNLPFSATAEDLEGLFGSHGHVEQVRCPAVRLPPSSW